MYKFITKIINSMVRICILMNYYVPRKLLIHNYVCMHYTLLKVIDTFVENLFLNYEMYNCIRCMYYNLLKEIYCACIKNKNK